MIRPRIELVPDFAVSSGDAAHDICLEAGLCLDDWQRHVLDNALGIKPDGTWAAFQTALLVPRQQGKSELAVARMLAGLFVFGEEVIIFSAHEVKTATEIFLRVRRYIHNSPSLRRRVAAIRLTNGEHQIVLDDGRRLMFLARSTAAGRGFSCDCLILDEAFALTAEQVAAIFPTLSARPNPQMWVMSSAGMEFSDQLKAIRDRGIAGKDESLAYFEWSSDPSLDPSSVEAWRQANPALGIRLTEDFVRLEFEAMPELQFRRERLGHWEEGLGSPIDPAWWTAAIDPRSQLTGAVCFAIDVSPDRSTAAISVAGRRADGRVHGEVIAHGQGTDWVIDTMTSLYNTWEPPPVDLDPAGPAGSLIPGLKESGVEVNLINSRELAQACGDFFDALKYNRFRHIDQAPLNTAVAGAAQRPLEDAWAWSRQLSGVDITPLVSVTIAARGFASYMADTPGPVVDSVW